MYFRYGEPRWEPADTSPLAPGAARPFGSPETGLGGRSGFRRAARLPSVSLCDVQINAVTELDCVRHILAELDAGRGGMVVTPNLDHLHRCVHDLNFAALVSEAEVVVA